MLDSSKVAVRIRRMRIAAGLSQAEFANRIGVAVGSVSKIENGRMQPTDVMLNSMAAIFDCSTGFLQSAGQEPLINRPWLRAYADASKRAVDQQLADCVIASEVIDGLRLKTIPDTLPVFDGDLTNDWAIEAFAHEVREAAHISEGDVVGNTVRAAERLGCVVLPMGEELGRHLGMSMRVNTIPMIRASRPSHDPTRHVPGDRQRWTVAHEIGHLALHTTLGPPQSAEDAARMEQQAHRFAGAFLAPGDAMLQELGQLGGRVTLRTLAKIKESWGLAIKALVMRFRTLGVIDEDHARSLHKQISARGWNKNEPVPVGNEEAVWLHKAINKAANDSCDPMTACASTVGIGRAYVERWTDWSPTGYSGPDARVLTLPQRSRGTVSGPSLGRGSVSKLPARGR